MPMNLHSRKRQLVRDAIYDAAIDLFARKGFDETTVEEVAAAAGISRRSFFRYFESKDDLLALNTVHCGEILCKTLASCPANLDLIEVMRETVSAGLRYTEAQKRTRQIIEISLRSASARQAHLSRLMEVEDKVATAFAARMKSVSPYSMRPSLFAGMSQLLINAAVASWFVGENTDIVAAAKHGLLTLTEIFSGDSSASPDVLAASVNDAPPSRAAKKKQLIATSRRPGNTSHFARARAAARTSRI